MFWVLAMGFDHVTILVSRILRWLLHFPKICAPVILVLRVASSLSYAFVIRCANYAAETALSNIPRRNNKQY